MPKETGPFECPDCGGMFRRRGWHHVRVMTKNGIEEGVDICEGWGEKDSKGSPVLD